MGYKDPERERAYSVRRAQRRTLDERLRRRAYDRARYWATKRMATEGHKPGDYLRFYTEEHDRAVWELRGVKR